MKEQMNQLKTFLRCHRRTRRHAALQNLFCAAVLFGLGLILVRSYAAAHTVEAVVDRWCEKNFFGKAEICSTLIYEENGTEHRDVFIVKKTKSGKYYEARLFMEQENFLKWINVGSVYSAEGKEYKLGTCQFDNEKKLHTADGSWDIFTFSGEDVASAFSELEEISSVEVSCFPCEIMDGDGNATSIYPALSITAKQSQTLNGTQYEGEVYFVVNMDTMEVTVYAPGNIFVDGIPAQLCLSEERMVFMAEKFMDALPEDALGVVT